MSAQQSTNVSRRGLSANQTRNNQNQYKSQDLVSKSRGMSKQPSGVDYSGPTNGLPVPLHSVLAKNKKVTPSRWEPNRYTQGSRNINMLKEMQGNDILSSKKEYMNSNQIKSADTNSTISTAFLRAKIQQKNEKEKRSKEDGQVIHYYAQQDTVRKSIGKFLVQNVINKKNFKDRISNNSIEYMSKTLGGFSEKNILTKENETDLIKLQNDLSNDFMSGGVADKRTYFSSHRGDHNNTTNENELVNVSSTMFTIAGRANSNYKGTTRNKGLFGNNDMIFKHLQRANQSVLIEKDSKLKFQDQLNIQKTEREDYIDSTSYYGEVDDQVDDTITQRVKVPDPFVFPVRVKPVDQMVAWQKKRALFQQQLRSQSKVQGNIDEDELEALANEDRTYMDYQAYLEIKNDEVIHQQNYQIQLNKIRAIQAEKKKKQNQMSRQQFKGSKNISLTNVSFDATANDNQIQGQKSNSQRTLLDVVEPQSGATIAQDQSSNNNSAKKTERSSKTPATKSLTSLGEPVLVKNTQFTKILNPKMDMKMKLKCDNGYALFQECLVMMPQKFQFQKHMPDKDGSIFRQELMNKQFFKENPNLIQFARKNKVIEEDNEDVKMEVIDSDHGKKKRTKEVSHLKWGRPFFGIYDRYGSGASNLEADWKKDGPGHDFGIPNVGQYFVTDEPLKVQRLGKNFNWVSRKKNINDKGVQIIGDMPPNPKSLKSSNKKQFKRNRHSSHAK